MNEVTVRKLVELTEPTVLFSRIDKLELPELDNAETDPQENHQDNGAMPTVDTQPSPSHSTLEDASVAPAVPPPHPCVKAGSATLQAQEGDLPDVCLLGADYMLYGAYQDWVHKNLGYHLDGGTAKDSKWLARRKKIVCLLTQRYDAPSGKVGKRFVRFFSVELDRIRARKCDAERVIVFQSVILQCAQGVNNSAQIRNRFLFRPYLWSRGVFEELVKYTYNSTMG